jgi:predicted Ser/Thr protein kinase
LIIGGRFEILREIGRGAMGVVYLARDVTLERDVALKELSIPAGLTAGAQQEMVARFQREARAAARLQHPNIVSVFDTIAEGGRYFIAMEYLDGAPLSDLIDRGGLRPGAAREVALQTLDAVACAHRAGVVHRDIKPDNIFVLSDGRVKVADFGIAKLMDGAGSGTMTQVGAVIGTPGYMSPEQVRGEAVDGRSDIFSIGVVLYEMLGGRNPFLADSPTTIMYRIVHEDPPALQIAELPGGGALEAIARKAIAKNAADRYNSADEMATDIRGGVAPALTPPPPVTSSGAQRSAARRGPDTRVLIGAGVAILVAAVILIFAFGGTGPSPGAVVVPSPDRAPEATQTVVTTVAVVPEAQPAGLPGLLGGTFTPGWTIVYASEKDQGAAMRRMRSLVASGLTAAVLDTNYFKDEQGKGLTPNYYAVVIGSYGSSRSAASSASKRYGGYPRYAVPK